MYTIPEFFAVSFLIGLTGALAPGPTLVATINESLRSGWTAGPRVSLGHIAIEFAIAVAIIFGLSKILAGYTGTICIVGGAVLIIFGIMNLLSARRINSGGLYTSPAAAPFTAGVLTSAANPYFWIWWLTVGAGFLLDGISGGILFAAAFLLGHWAADVGWFTFVSAGVSKGRTVMPDRAYRGIVGSCGVFLIAFGIWYISGAMA